MKQPIVPSLTATAMQRLDNLMVKEFGISPLQMMEHDARALTEVAKSMVSSLATTKVLVFSGQGGNGAAGLAAARHLHNAGAEVTVVLAGGANVFSGAGKKQLDILKKIGLDYYEVSAGSAVPKLEADLVLDALLGYAATGDPREPYSTLVTAINDLALKGAAVLANDIPSGLDVETGRPHNPCVKADATVTLALPKTGLLTEAAVDWVGQLFLADIGVPPEVYDKLEIAVPNLFEQDWLIKL
jgi:NAD(P)H-hydrate epimerase